MITAALRMNTENIGIMKEESGIPSYPCASLRRAIESKSGIGN